MAVMFLCKFLFTLLFCIQESANASSRSGGRSSKSSDSLLSNDREARAVDTLRDDISLAALERRGKKRRKTRYTMFTVESPAGHLDINFEATIKFVKTSLDLIADFDHYPEIKFFVDRKHRSPTTNEELPYRYAVFSIDLEYNRTTNMQRITEFVRTSSDFMHADHMQIFVQTASGKSVSLNVDAEDTVENIKNRIRDVEGIPTNLQRLEYQGQTLANARRLYDYNIKKDSILDLRHDIEINVRLSPTLVVTLKASPSDTVASLKARLLEFGTFTLDRIQLEFAGQELKNDAALKAYHITNGSILQATVRQITLPAPAT
uniref:Ubiquitin-like domain-containing protein n=1 Tax=Romanomermis culicivorax TaxID=13658 RepID=A0A915IJ81_ROMCU